MTAAYFDSNIMVYAVDPRDAEQVKRDVARFLLKTRRPHLSVQVMMETYHVLTRKKIIAKEAAKAFVERLSFYPVALIDAEDARIALNYAERYGITHLGALHVRAAERSRTSILYSEDLNHGQTYGSVQVCNPFIEDFLN
ncbi:MAG: PIN domain-containing protein [Litorimonas sp.]